MGTTLTSAGASFSPENESCIRRPTIATGGFKCAKLAGGMKGSRIYANPEALVNAAVTGVFTPTARRDYWSQPREMRLASEKDEPLYDGSLPMISWQRTSVWRCAERPRKTGALGVGRLTEA